MAGIAAIPAPDSGWMLVSGDSEIARAETLSALIGRRPDVVIGLPSALVSTFAVALPPTDSSLHTNMIHAQVEKRGLAGTPGETLIDYDLIGHDPEGDTFAVTVVPPLPEELIVTTAAGYSTAAALLPSPVDGCRIWMEQGRNVFGIYHEGIPIHVQVLSGSTELDRSAAQEVSLTLMSLQGDPALSGHLPSGLEFCVPNLAPQSVQIFSEVLDIPVTESHRPNAVVDRVEGRDKLLPPAVSRSRSSRKNGQRAVIIGTAVLIAYCVAAAWMWVSARNTANEIESMERQLSILEPDVERIQQVEQRWNVLEPAFEKTWFPVVQLSRLTSALPGSGVVIREFRTNSRNIRVIGQARDVQLANQLLEDLQGMKEFAAYDWSMPNPKVEKNNTATFVISGGPKNAEPDN
ncbi:MAG: hypothetical protein P1U87_15825 [Verrucomicrobiales bacterium]|nr:hypothetical protein [Verrucomicrobiales bacterium]